MTDTFTFAGRNRVYLGARAQLIETDREIASEWASGRITINPAHAWVLGKFVEADRANSNGQFFAMDGLEFGKPTIDHAPMNINHSARNIVGAFVASELMFPEAESAGEFDHPYIESLGVMWKYYFPEEYRNVQHANENGGLFYSMECVPRAVSSVGGSDDSVEYEYAGRQSPTYPTELNAREVPMKLIDPHFVGGALIIPPVKPGWSNANTKVVAGFMNDCWQEAERAFESIAPTAGEMWEQVMGELILLDARQEDLHAQIAKLSEES